jgi:hypothetical protein
MKFIPLIYSGTIYPDLNNPLILVDFGGFQYTNSGSEMQGWEFQ